MRISARIVLVSALGLAVAAPAVASTFETGKYTGKTDQKNKRTHKFRKISLHADSAAGQLSNIKFVSTGECSDDSHSSGDQGKGDNKLFAEVDGNGDFSFTAKSSTGGTKLTMSGNISGSKVSGTFTVKSRFNKKGESDPNGSIRCSSGLVKWSAKLTG